MLYFLIPHVWFKTETAQSLQRQQSTHENCKMDDVQVHYPETTDESQNTECKE